MICRRVHTGCANYGDDGKAKRPDAETHDGALAALPCGDAGFMKTMEADRHPRAALVRTIDSLMASRHSTLGTT